MNRTTTLQPTKLLIKLPFMCALLALAAPLAALAQQVVFYDTFANSTLNGGATTNMQPGGTPTASWTSYEIGSAKNALSTTNNAGNLFLISGATSAGITEAQALFTRYPVTLASLGDYVELDYTFTDSTNILQGNGGQATGPQFGLYNSGGVPPLAGTILGNSGFSSSLTSADVGGVQNWVGYYATMWYGATAASYSWYIDTRPAQTAANNTDQELGYGAAGGSSKGAAFQGVGFPNLTVGSQYTAQLRITLSAAGTLTVSNALYAGAGISGAPIFTNIANETGANLLTTNFDGLFMGFRAGPSTVAWTNDINSVTVIAGLAAQAGPYFFVTSSGNPCSGGVDVGLSGSVTTNTYLLFANGTFSGQALAGTGSALDFGIQSAPANYTVIASNTVTASTGPMYGSANVYEAGIAVNTEPSSVTLVTNLPASFSIAATGAALSYQWYENGVPLTNNANISGAQTATLNFAAAQAGNAATTLNGYTVVVQDPCGDIVTSTPPAALILTPPNNLVWQGNNNGGAWDLTNTLNFTNSLGVSEVFSNGDIVIFNDSSLGTSVTMSGNLTPTLTAVTGTQSYTFGGTGKLTGFGQLVDASSGTLTIANKNSYTGGTVVSNGATLALGSGSGIVGSVGGTVTVNSGGTLQYNYQGPGNTTPVNLNEILAGSGMVNYIDQAGSILATPVNAVSSNFSGTINIQGYTCLHASDQNAGYALGNGSTINAPDGTQVWLDRSATAYNDAFNIGGNGWLGATPQTGAMRVYGNTINGPINLLDNARIGGTIGGGTLQGVISGPYQLEVWGTTNSFVLVMGPTNGQPQAYASTLITGGSIQAANTNAISTGPLTLDSGGDLRLFGNNLTVSSLSSIASGEVLLIEGPRVRNMNTTNSATLTVGADGTSTEFDGTFSDGANAAFGLTKVGGGTLTLTLVSSNSGPVTVLGGTIALGGSAAFTKAPIVLGSGGIFDVTGIGGSLTLNSGQYFEGNGALTGSLIAPAGSIVQPGMPMGTLTASGSATINGTYRSSLNRTNLGNCSTFTAAGGITFSGATLGVTNIGPALQPNDAFQLFPGATPGITTFNLQAYDYGNKVNYTWNNTVASNGKITVATVVSRVLALQTAPTASAVTYGQAISNSVVSGGAITNASGTAVTGTYAFVTPGTMAFAGTTNVAVTFNPSDTTDYNAFTFNVSVTVNPQTPKLKTTPTASTITNGYPLSASSLTGGVVTNAFSTNVVAGAFAFTTPAATPGVGTASQSVTFSPTDANDYSSFTFNVNVTVVAAPGAVTALKFTGRPVISGNTLTISGTNTGSGTFYLLTSTNLASPLNAWSPIWTNVAGGSGNFTTNLNNAVNQALGRQFYILSTNF